MDGEKLELEEFSETMEILTLTILGHNQWITTEEQESLPLMEESKMEDMEMLSILDF